ncbi:MAG: glycosyltransferase [Gammaproteobacteria bacterium]|nr:glycosyltransferase [Gammaproteobacteria bacterium]
MNGVTDKPHLLVLTSTFPRWRDDHEPPFVYELCRRLTAHFAVTVVAPHAAGAARSETLDGIEVRRFRYAPMALQQLAYDGGIPAKIRAHPWLGMLVPGFVLSQLLSARRILQEHDTSVIHAHWIVPGGLIGALLSAFAGQGCRLLVTAHGGDVYGLNGALATRVKRWVLRRADHVTVVGSALAQQVNLHGDLDGKLSVLPMGTDLSETFVPAPRQTATPTVIYAGRLVEKKGVDVLLRALASARERVPELQLIIAGHGPAQPALETLCRQLAIGDAVRFTGPYRMHELPRMYADAQLAVFPFRAAAGGDQDGFGLAVVEAMGCGIPVVGSDIAPLDDLLIDGATALRAKTNDAEAFADAIVECLANPQATRQRASAARAHVLAHYDWQVIAARYAELLRAPVNAENVRPSPQDS